MAVVPGEGTTARNHRGRQACLPRSYLKALGRMDEHSDYLRELIDAATDCQIRMQAEVGIERLERYLAKTAAFMEWCRDQERGHAEVGLAAPPPVYPAS